MSNANGREDAELRRELEQALSDYFGEEREIDRVRRRPYEYRTTFAIDELDVVLAGGERLNLILKDLSWETLDAVAREAKPRFLYDPLREIEVYRALAEHGVGPAFYGSAVDPDRDRYWIFIEKVEGTELWQIGAGRVWRKVARWLARFHERFADLRPPHSIVYDGDLYRTWLDRAREFTGARELDRIAARYDEVVERLLGLPAVFLHGEFYPSNILVCGSEDEVRICAVDWEMAAIGPALVDLAALSEGWDEKEADELVRAYRSALADPPPADAFQVAFECSRLHLAVQWLGWAREWAPPEEHAIYWLDEAVETAARLGL